MKIRSGLPISYFVWVLLSAATLVVLIVQHVNLAYAFFASLIVSIVTYFVLARFACTVELDDSIITIKYAFPWRRVIELKLTDIRTVEAELSYFYFLADDHRMRGANWYYPYDTFTFEMKGKEGPEQNVVNINSSFLGTLKLYRYLKSSFNGS